MASGLQLRLSYLPFRAMAETTRFILRFGGVAFQDEVVWGRVFAERRAQGAYPFDKVPILQVKRQDGSEYVVAQSGSIARMAAKLAGCYPEDPVHCAFNDAVFEMAQELCTINPMINCYTGSQFNQIKAWYFGSLPVHLDNLQRQLDIASTPYYGGDTPSHADFNVYHHLSNAKLAEPGCVDGFQGLQTWIEKMEALSSMKAYLEERPVLTGIGVDPGLVDSNGRLVQQRDPEGRLFLENGKFTTNPAD